MPLAWILIKTWFGLSSRLGTSFTSHFALTAGTIAAFIVTPRFSLRSVSSRFLLWAELVHVSYIGNSRSSQTPTVREPAESLKLNKVYTLARVSFRWRSDAVPKPPCRNIGRRRNIGVRSGGGCRAFSFWTGASSVSYRGGQRGPMGFREGPKT